MTVSNAVPHFEHPRQLVRNFALREQFGHVQAPLFHRPITSLFGHAPSQTLV
jgi:hypothetical protein